MKKILLVLTILIIGFTNIIAQAIVEPCISDAALHRNDACPWQTTNYGTHPYNMAATWTWFGPGCAQGDIRPVVQFNIDLSKPKKLYDDRAVLDLYYPSASTQISTFVGSATENSFKIEHVTSPWVEMVVTWDTQPTSTPAGSLIVPTSTLNDTSDLHFNVSTLVDDWICGTLPNYGIKLTLVNEGGTYRRRTYASRNHSDTTTHPTLTLQYATIEASADITICSGQVNPLSCSLTNAAIPSVYTFQWQHLNSATIYNGQNIANANYVSGTNTYVVTVTNPYCQSANDTVVVTVDSAITTTQNLTICAGDSILLGGIFQTAPGIYYDSLQSYLTCDSIIATTLTVNSSGTQADAGIDQELCDDILTFTLNGNTPLISGEVGSWSIQSGTGMLIDSSIPNTTGSNLSIGSNIFVWTITNPACPATTDFVTLNVESCTPSGVFIPNTFTVNEDGLNDGFYPQGFGIAKNDYSFMIFNRWGELLFESQKLGQPWYGDYKGEPVPNGVYVWKLRFIDTNGIKHAKVGHVNLLK